MHNNPPFLPFKPFRGFMYTQKELAESDHAIYDYYLKSKDIHSKMWEVRFPLFLLIYLIIIQISQSLRTIFAFMMPCTTIFTGKL